MKFKFALGFFTFLIVFLVQKYALAASSVGSAKVNSVVVKPLTNGTAVDVSFDKALSAEGIEPLLERGFVQAVFKPASIRSAKTISVDSKGVDKVFTYAYAPDVTRVRIFLKNSHEWAQGKVKIWNTADRSIRIFIESPQDSRNAETLTSATLSGSIKEVLEKPKNQPPSPETKVEGTALSAVAKEPQVGTKSDPSKHFIRMALSLSAILLLFLTLVFIGKKYASKIKALPFGKKERIIQVVATHYLGNKKSMSLVKVAGEYLVVGVSNEGVSLITKLGAEVDVQKYIDDRFWGGTFEKHLHHFSKDEILNQEPNPQILPQEKITSRFRENIKEKLSHLKQLS